MNNRHKNNYNDFKKYRAELRYKYFNNNKYDNASTFYQETDAIDFWDTNFFHDLLKIPSQRPHIKALRFQNRLDAETNNPTIDWHNMFNYFNSLQKHPYFNHYFEQTYFDADPLFWKILIDYKNKLTGQLENNQQLWI